MLRTFVLHVSDDPDVLTRVALLCRRRRFTIDSLTIGRTEEPGVRRLTLSVEADADSARRLAAFLGTLVDVSRVEDVTDRPVVLRDLAMIKVTAPPESRGDIMQLVQVFRARVVDVAAESLVIETTGTEDKVDGLLQVLRPFGVMEMVRTGRLAMCRGT
ncbi:MAG: acetolactate synthase small subunit [Acidobacteria bacterium]|nr:MAG: acetolactate synthase small subunit [Acidobacteriota bacterium]